jgi:hypothetical protein
VGKTPIFWVFCRRREVGFRVLKACMLSVFFLFSLQAEVSVAAHAEKATSSVIQKYAYDFEIGGSALENWISTVVDLDHVESTFPWRTKIDSDTQLAVLESLHLEDPKTLELIPEKYRREILAGTNTHSGTSLFKSDLQTIIGSDGKPLTTGLILPDSAPLDIKPLGISSGILDQSGRPLQHTPILIHEEATLLVDPGQKKIFESINTAQKNRDIMYSNWKRILENESLAAEVFKEIPLKAYGAKEKIYLIKAAKSPYIYLHVKEDLPLLKNTVATLDGDTLELKARSFFTSRQEFNEHLVQLSKRLGNQASIFAPAERNALRAGAFHLHVEFDPTLLSEEEFDEFINHYKFKNALETNLRKEVFGAEEMNQYFRGLRSRGNVRKGFADHYHVEFRELNVSPENFFKEMDSYFDGIDGMKAESRLKLIQERLQKNTMELVNLHWPEFERGLENAEAAIRSSAGRMYISSNSLRQYSDLLIKIAADPSLKVENIDSSRNRLVQLAERCNRGSFSVLDYKMSRHPENSVSILETYVKEMDTNSELQQQDEVLSRFSQLLQISKDSKSTAYEEFSKSVEVIAEKLGQNSLFAFHLSPREGIGRIKNLVSVLDANGMRKTSDQILKPVSLRISRTDDPKFISDYKKFLKSRSRGYAASTCALKQLLLKLF